MNPFLSVSKESITVYVGRTEKFTASTTPQKTISVVEYPDDYAKLEVSQSGGKATVKVTGLKKGTTNITVSANGIVKQVKVTVK